MRARTEARKKFLLRKSDGSALSKGYPSTVWRTHFDTGAHISWTRIHTELSKLGPAGVEAALALCAQRDARSRLHYQAESVAMIEMERGQRLTEELFEDLPPETWANLRNTR